MVTFESWEKIQTDWDQKILPGEKKGILLGNGASIALHPQFQYDSLQDEAIKEKYFQNDDSTATQIKNLFSTFNTTDFEKILKKLKHAQEINDTLFIEDNQTETLYKTIQSSFIKSIQKVHCKSLDDEDRQKIYDFLKYFHTVCSLNYDLTLYWSYIYFMHNTDDQHSNKDGFTKDGTLAENWQEYSQTYNELEKTITMFFYPHGNLMLTTTENGYENKILKSSSVDSLLKTIISKWENGHIPLFVSEGTTEQKLSTIKSHYYLRTVYNEVLTNIGNYLVIYGCGFQQNDKHIFNQILRSHLKEIAVSVFDEHDYDFLARIASRLNNKKIKLRYFDAKKTKFWPQITLKNQ